MFSERRLGPFAIPAKDGTTSKHVRLLECNPWHAPCEACGFRGRSQGKQQMACLTAIFNDAIPAAARAARVVPVLTDLIDFELAALGLHKVAGF